MDNDSIVVRPALSALERLNNLTEALSEDADLEPELMLIAEEAQESAQRVARINASLRMRAEGNVVKPPVLYLGGDTKPKSDS